jgi:hypothetical protein
MTDEYQALSTFGMTLLGSGLGTTLVAAWFKKHFDRELEQHKALLQRSTRVHEKQIDALLDIYSRLERSHFFLLRAASSGVLEGEDKSEIVKVMVNELAGASEAYSKKKLLIPPSLSLKLDTFFGRFLSARVDLNFAMRDDVPAGHEKAELWQRAQTEAYAHLPPLLEAIELEARTVIHG